MPDDGSPFDFSSPSDDSFWEGWFAAMWGSGGSGGGRRNPGGNRHPFRRFVVTASCVTTLVGGAVSILADSSDNKKAVGIEMCLSGQDPKATPPQFAQLLAYQVFNSVPTVQRDVSVIENRVVVTEVTGSKNYASEKGTGTRYFTTTYAMSPNAPPQADTIGDGYIDSFGKDKAVITGQVAANTAYGETARRYSRIKECVNYVVPQP